MTSTFDVSTTAGDDGHAALPAGTAEAFEPGDAAPMSLLDQLRARVDDRDEAEPDEWCKEIPRLGIRLVCDPNIESGDYQRWVRSAQPKRRGRARATANVMDLDQFALCVRGLSATCIRLDIKRGEQWEPMRGNDGAVYDLESRDLLSAFGVMDSGSLLRKLFGRDARVIDAGQELFAEAGYLDNGDDDDNPE